MAKTDPMALPEYFSELAPLREHFQQGLPILCYHKIEPVPAGARIKGLYLSRSLFREQIRQLAAEGYSFCLPGPHSASSSVAITFDDGFVSNLDAAVPAMREMGARAINYLVAERIGKTSDWESAEGGEARPLMDSAQIRDWITAGNWIGAHTCTHPRLSKIPRERAREEIVSGKKKLEDLLGQPVEHFAYPFGDYNDAVVELVREAGFKTACTMDRGVNDRATDPFRLKRWTARYPTRTIASLIRKIFKPRPGRKA